MANNQRIRMACAAIALAALLLPAPADAQNYSQTYSYVQPQFFPFPLFQSVAPQERVAPAERMAPTEAMPPSDEANPDPRFRRQIVSYQGNEAAGTVIVDTPNTYLYYVLGNGRAIRYGIGVGREGFTWSGVQSIARKSEWPDWYPPADMIERQPYLPRFVAGGEGNPLGARALYLGNSAYRIHGTNKPSSIGARMSSGCIRMLNADVIDLYDRVQIGTKVIVLPENGRGFSAAPLQDRQSAVMNAPVRLQNTIY